MFIQRTAKSCICCLCNDASSGRWSGTVSLWGVCSCLEGWVWTCRKSKNIEFIRGKRHVEGKKACNMHYFTELLEYKVHTQDFSIRFSTCVLQVEQYCLILPGWSLWSIRHWSHSYSARWPHRKHSRGAARENRRGIRAILSVTVQYLPPQNKCYQEEISFGMLVKLTTIQDICDVQLCWGNDFREHLELLSKSWHLNYKTRWNLK